MTEYGDVEAAAVEIVGQSALIAALGEPAPGISTGMVGFEAGQRWVRLTRAGGVPTHWRRHDNAAMAVECYGTDKADALALASAVRAALFAARGTYNGQGLSVYDVKEDKGVTWEPDDRNPGLARYTFALTIVTKT